MQKKHTIMETNCPCGSGLIYSHCCGPYLTQNINAPTALALMRSRYTAFTLANVDYILRTYHPQTRPINQRQQIHAWAKSVTWMGLTIMDLKNGHENDDSGTVEFIAHYIENGKPSKIHEMSQFKKEKGQWKYVTGKQP